VILVVHLSNMCFAIFRTVQLCQNCPIMHGRFIITRTNQMLLWVSCVRRRLFFPLHALEKWIEMPMMIKSSEVDSQHLLSLYNVSSKLSASESLSVSEELTPMDH